MSWPCRYFPNRAAITEQCGYEPTGAMWPAEPSWLVPETLAANYIRDWQGKRPALLVMLPCGFPFLIDGRAYDDEKGGYFGDGWVVTGEPPRITVSPSINFKRHYHGFLQHGVISDDCEGRTFPNARGFPPESAHV